MLVHKLYVVNSIPSLFFKLNVVLYLPSFFYSNPLLIDLSPRGVRTLHQHPALLPSLLLASCAGGHFLYPEASNAIL